MAGGSEDRERRVVLAAEAALAEHRAVSAVDVLVGLGWLGPSHLAMWRQGRTQSLEEMSLVRPVKLATALGELERWARRLRLVPSEAA